MLGGGLSLARSRQRPREISEHALGLAEQEQEIWARALVADLLRLSQQVDERLLRASGSIGPEPVLGNGEERLVEHATVACDLLQRRGLFRHRGGSRVTEQAQDADLRDEDVSFEHLVAELAGELERIVRMLRALGEPLERVVQR